MARISKRKSAAKKGWETRRAKARARSLAAKKAWVTRRKNERSLAAKKGWEKRKLKEARRVKSNQEKILSAAKLSEKSAIVYVEGPHKRDALSKDWDGNNDIGEMAQTVKRSFPTAVAWNWAFKFRFLSNVGEEDLLDKGFDPKAMEGEDKWVSIGFGIRTTPSEDFKRQVQNARDYLEVFTSGKMNYGLVLPLTLTVVVDYD